MATTYPLPDGSTALVEPIDARSSLISRTVEGECVWGQAFSTGGEPENHEAQIVRVLIAMAADPGSFTWWWN